MAELCKEIRDKCSDDGINCSEKIILLCTDGGGDHNVLKTSVQVGVLCLFLQLDLHCLIAMKTCATESWLNPAERVLCILNYAQQHCALKRDKMDINYEGKMRNKNARDNVCKILERYVLSSKNILPK